MKLKALCLPSFCFKKTCGHRVHKLKNRAHTGKKHVYSFAIGWDIW